MTAESDQNHSPRTHPTPTEPTATRIRVTPNLFSIAFGFAGLANCWQFAHAQRWAPAWPATALFCVSALVWAVLVVAWGAQFRPGRLRLGAELRHPVYGPFVSLPPIVGMLLGAALALVAPDAGRVIVDVFAFLTLGLGGWLTAGWIMEEGHLDDWHPGYFLPTIAGGLVAAGPLAAVGQRGLAQCAFGIGMICWLSLGSVVLGRLFVRPLLPAPLLPTLAIEAAPPAVAANAVLLLNGDHWDLLSGALTGYAVLMMLVQLRLVRIYRDLAFSAGFWAFSFSYATVAALALRLIAASRPGIRMPLADTVLAAITLLVLGLTIGTIRALALGSFLVRTPRA
ncbi:TDT family transporter [Pseudonocardia spinosispora]|uniref:SLAC1 family transporter n=1 Tax=Pseudonocardia spinosispora TaxID=103441 RepID=UPI0012EC79C3|nr:TDT family transporter [Pseudonocardia spinosispora]